MCTLKLCKSKGGLKLHEMRMHDDVDVLQEENSQNVSCKENAFTEDLIKEQLRGVPKNSVIIQTFSLRCYLTHFHIIWKMAFLITL